MARVAPRQGSGRPIEHSPAQIIPCGRISLFGYAFATLISIGSVLQEEITYRRYNDWRDVARLVCFCFLEHFPYRQLHMWWRLRGIWQFLRGDLAWGQHRRTGFAAQSTNR